MIAGRIRARVDTALGRVSMYRLVLAALGVVVLAALVLAVTGTLSYSPLAVLLTLAVATATTALGTLLGRLAAGLWSPRPPSPHWTSSLVTGAILALVLMPATGTDLVTPAVAGLAAGLSKYLLAWRGRHVLNPAVAGLIVLALLEALGVDVGVSAWWVGSYALLPVVVVTGLVVLWRTRRLLFAASYAVPALALTLIGYVTLGTTWSQAFSFTLTASPVFFLAAFMLSEPLTIPPRQRQRLLVGALVAVLAAAPLFLEWGWLTPEVALAVGNVVAFALGLRGGVVLRLRERLGTPELLDLRFTPSRPLRFLPGQYVEIDVPQALAHDGAAWDARGRRRVLSVASAPGSGVVRLVTRAAPSSSVAGPSSVASSSVAAAPASPVKRALAALAPGDEVRVTLVGGDFLLPTGPVALIGAGIGVTPFLAQLDALARGEIGPPEGGWDVVLVHAVRDVAEVLDVVTLAAPDVPGGGVLGALPARAVLPAGVALVLVVPPGSDVGAVPAGWRVIEGTVLTGTVLEGTVLEREVLAAAVPDIAGREVLVSGSPLAVEAVRLAARSLGVQRLRTDVFLGY